MRKWKKAAVAALVFTVVAQCAVMCVAAAHASVSKYSADRNTVFIDLYGDEKDADASTTGNEGGSITGNEAGSAAGNGTGGVAGSDVVSPDFVTQFPGSLFWSGLQTQVPAGEPAVQEVYEEMSAFVQEAYEDALYGSGTVASCGSSVTSLAMVATYLTGYEYRPDELARSFAGKADTDVVRTVSGCDALGLPYEETKEWGDMVETRTCAAVGIGHGRRGLTYEHACLCCTSPECGIRQGSQQCNRYCLVDQEC